MKAILFVVGAAILAVPVYFINNVGLICICILLCLLSPLLALAFKGR